MCLQVLFEMALEHLTRILRLVRNPRGNALLVGVGGSGKQSLTKLATFCAGYTLFEITLTRSYNEAEFRNDLKTLYKLLGERHVVFLFTDAHVLEEGFLELINNMLTTGMVVRTARPCAVRSLRACVHVLCVYVGRGGEVRGWLEGVPRCAMRRIGSVVGGRRCSTWSLCNHCLRNGALSRSPSPVPVSPPPPPPPSPHPPRTSPPPR